MDFRHQISPFRSDHNQPAARSWRGYRKHIDFSYPPGLSSLHNTHGHQKCYSYHRGSKPRSRRRRCIGRGLCSQSRRIRWQSIQSNQSFTICTIDLSSTSQYPAFYLWVSRSPEWGRIRACHILPPSSKSLYLYAPQFWAQTSYQHTFNETIPHLRNLHLRLPSSEQLLQWLLNSCQNLALETFDLRIYYPCHRGVGPITILNSFLVAKADTLTHFSFGIVFSIEPLTQNEGMLLSTLCLGLSQIKLLHQAHCG